MLKELLEKIFCWRGVAAKGNKRTEQCQTKQQADLGMEGMQKRKELLYGQFMASKRADQIRQEGMQKRKELLKRQFERLKREDQIKRKDEMKHKCGMPLVIDEWNGWVWTCFHCDVIVRPATRKEIAEMEKQTNQQTEDLLKKQVNFVRIR